MRQLSGAGILSVSIGLSASVAVRLSSLAENDARRRDLDIDQPPQPMKMIARTDRCAEILDHNSHNTVHARGGIPLMFSFLDSQGNSVLQYTVVYAAH